MSRALLQRRTIDDDGDLGGSSTVGVRRTHGIDAAQCVGDVSAVGGVRTRAISGGDGIAQPVSARTGDAGESKTEDPCEEGPENE